MIPVQISTQLEGKAYTATLRCVLKGQEHIVLAKGRLEKVKRKPSSQCRFVEESGRHCENSQDNNIFNLRRRDMVRKDCFGYDARCGARKTDRCTALTKLYCATEECKFYKTKEEYERQERREKNED